MVDIPSFNGSMAIDEFLDWIAEIDRFFSYMETPPEKLVRLVACHLKGGASAWWEWIQSRRGRKGKGPIRTWYRIKYLLKREFLPQILNRSCFSSMNVVNRVIGLSMNTLRSS
ncbi:hypothetical protein IHE45_12G064300 [Dioscorea alata]|uniref:Uncharacterized protein n=1 Tax=Dioscorea alata TaxID=55571 RepID=A0ACB7V2X6_DIOAL|nr:hypothetical protein IHE45_12G064300 [Dioscorea alata]